jgi:hypothetical protein
MIITITKFNLPIPLPSNYMQYETQTTVVGTLNPYHSYRYVLPARLMFVDFWGTIAKKPAELPKATHCPVFPLNSP